MSMDATKEQFEYVELFGKPALFTNLRMDVSTVPLGFTAITCGVRTMILADRQHWSCM